MDGEVHHYNHGRSYETIVLAQQICEIVFLSDQSEMDGNTII